MKKSIVSFSGGLDSTTCLVWALRKGYDVVAVNFDYGQRHKREKESARKIAKLLGIELVEIKLNIPFFSSSSLVDIKKEIPKNPVEDIGTKIPSTYVPARNLVFASVLVSYAESIDAKYVIMGPNAVDFSGYPDCRPYFYKYLNLSLRYGTKNRIKILTPIINLSKKQIIELAIKLKAPIQYTWSCYQGGEKPCGICDACRLRAKGFKELGIIDPAL